MNEFIESILKNEGGYVHDPLDRGGETNFGISKKSYPELDIKGLTKDEAIRIYQRDYWMPSKAVKLPKSLRGTYFDMVVNMGQGRAVRTLQKACNSNGSNLQTDGVIGSKTIKASESLEVERLKAYRVLFYASIVLTEPAQERFWYGWYKRGVQ
jgi:lysozyme family protein